MLRVCDVHICGVCPCCVCGVGVCGPLSFLLPLLGMVRTIVLTLLGAGLVNSTFRVLPSSTDAPVVTGLGLGDSKPGLRGE